MITGSGKALRRPGRRIHSMLLIALLAVGAPLAAQEVGLAGIMGSKAMLMINGGEPEAVRVGEALDGVKVISIQGDQVVVEIGGRKRPLRVGQHAVGAAPADGSGKAVLTADGRGHFYANAMVNGKPVRFLVDTGATSIALGASDARRLGLDVGRGQTAYAQIANGQRVEVSMVKLDTVKIGDVTLHQVDATVQRNDIPIALLGMSFLSRMEIQQDGGTMTLRQRF